MWRVPGRCAVMMAVLGIIGAAGVVQAAAVAGELVALDSKLAMRVPAGWEVQQRKQQQETELIVLSIPTPREATAAVSANVVIIGQSNRSRIQLTDLIESELTRSGQVDEQFAVQRIEHESDQWAVALCSSRDGAVAYVLYDHYAVTPNVAVSIRVVLPVMADAGEQWYASTLAHVNAFFRSATIDGARTGKWVLERVGGEFRLAAPTQ